MWHETLNNNFNTKLLPMSIPFFNYRKPKPVEKKKGKIILMATQKGGTGKSTNGILFANYLTDKGIQLLLIDADPQHSIKFKHEEEMKRHPDLKPLYTIYPFEDLDSEDKTLELIADIRKKELTVIIDTPGNLSLQGMIPLILEADIIIAPFQYEETCLESLTEFVNLNVMASNNAGREKMTPMIFLPNMHNKTWGRKDELEVNKEYARSLSYIGKVAPFVPSSPEMRRNSTLYTTDTQRTLTAPCYNFMYSIIYYDNL